MPNRMNPHVQRLHRYLPFDANHDQIYEENRDPKDTLELTTSALVYLMRVLSEDPSVIILTGDAGHGKTHLCSRVLKDHLKYSKEEALCILNDRCSGEQLQSEECSKPVSIFKDFSEFSIPNARQKLCEAINDDESVSIICVNEGRLRSILAGSLDDHQLDELRSEFNDSFKSGMASHHGKIHIINLNYQSVASSENALIDRVLSGESRRAGWLDGRSWAICDQCDSRDKCPIVCNRDLLAQEGNAAVRVRRIRELFSIVERLGTVVTIREILMTIAYLITGGLTCADVHRRNREGWQHDYTFYSLLFAPPSSLGRDKLARIPVLQAFKGLDPGVHADRIIDERLINEGASFEDCGCELTFSRKVGNQPIKIDAKGGIDEIVGNPRSLKERKAEADFTLTVIRNLRRRDFFEAVFDDGFEANRLGFNSYKDFWWLVSGEENMNKRVKIKNKLISGLHVMQGLRLPESTNKLHLVDPAFGRSTNNAAIITKKVPSNKVRLLKQSEGWGFLDEQKANSLPEVVDWIEREVLLSVSLSPMDTYQYPLNLFMFDCIMRASSGYLPETFYAHDIRKVSNFLGLLAESGRPDDESISIVVAGKMHNVTLEEGDQIVVSGD